MIVRRGGDEMHRWIGRFAMAVATVAAAALVGAIIPSVPRTQLSLSASASGAQSPSPAPSMAVVSVPDFRPFSGHFESGDSIAIKTSADCAAIKEAFIVSWCLAMTSDAPLALPATGGADADYPTFLAAVTRGLLASDNSVCSSPVIAHFIEVVGHTVEGTGACRASLGAAAEQGWVAITDPANGASLQIDLP